MSEMFCEICGQKIKDGDMFCTNCGWQVPAELVKAKPEEVQKEELGQIPHADKPVRKKGKGVIIAIVALCAVAAIAAALHMTGDTPEDESLVFDANLDGPQVLVYDMANYPRELSEYEGDGEDDIVLTVEINTDDIDSWEGAYYEVNRYVATFVEPALTNVVEEYGYRAVSIFVGNHDRVFFFRANQEGQIYLIKERSEDSGLWTVGVTSNGTAVYEVEQTGDEYGWFATRGKSLYTAEKTDEIISILEQNAQ